MKSLIVVFLACILLGTAPLGMAQTELQGEGIVTDSIDAGGYVYLKLEDNTWIAANHFEVSKGDKISYSGGMEMVDFQSKSLDRTFDRIYFVSKAGLAGQPQPTNPHQGMPVKQAAPAVEMAAVDIKHLKDGQTVATVFANAASLKEQVVSINARVIKINKSIMGRNWITLDDGTGAAPDNKLLATSQEEVSPGDIVTATGTINTDIDLGYGYRYKVLLEETTFAEGVQ